MINDKWHLRTTIQSIKRLQNQEASELNVMRMRKELEFALNVISKIEKELEKQNG